VLGKWDDFEMQHLEYVEVHTYPHISTVPRECEYPGAYHGTRTQASASLDPAVREALLSPDQQIRVKKKRRQERTLAPSVPVHPHPTFFLSQQQRQRRLGPTEIRSGHL
jgi:hypothetical protein